MSEHVDLNLRVPEDMAEEMVESIKELDEGERWEPQMAFDHEAAQEIQRRLRTQLKVHEHERN